MIEIIPSSPSESDIVTLKVEQPACIGAGPVRLINENPVFTVEVTTGGCFQPPAALRQSFIIGQLLPGQYTARIVFVKGPGDGATSGIAATKTFTVSASQARNIPTLDTASIILLTMVLALTVRKFMRRQSS